MGIAEEHFVRDQWQSEGVLFSVDGQLHSKPVRIDVLEARLQFLCWGKWHVVLRSDPVHALITPQVPPTKIRFQTNCGVETIVVDRDGLENLKQWIGPPTCEDLRARLRKPLQTQLTLGAVLFFWQVFSLPRVSGQLGLLTAALLLSVILNFPRPRARQFLVNAGLWWLAGLLIVWWLWRPTGLSLIVNANALGLIVLAFYCAPVILVAILGWREWQEYYVYRDAENRLPFQPRRDSGGR